MGLNFAAEENEGRIYVDLTGGRVDGLPGLPQQPPGYQPGGGYQSEGRPNQHHGGGGGGYPGQQQQQQQHGQQHHQQGQQQNQQEDDIWADLLGACFKKCCVVM